MIQHPTSTSTSDRFVHRVVITVAIVALSYMVWQTREVIMIIFGGLLLATLLDALTDGVKRYTPLSGKAAFATMLFGLVLLLGASGWWLGDKVLSQIQELREKLPEALEATRAWVEGTALGDHMQSMWEGAKDADIPWGNVAGFTGTALGALANTILIIAIGIYFAASPALYRGGLMRMVPPAHRSTADNAFSAASKGLRLWLIGQLITMTIIGILTAIGLYALGIPLAFSLGVIAALLEFVPFVGPIVFGVLAVLLAFIEGPSAAFQVALLTLVLQQLEGNVLTPIIQRRTVKLPPALGLVGIVIFGVLFGIPGILFATPLMVVVMILVKKLYIENALEGKTPSET